jgi:hypothetical protein
MGKSFGYYDEVPTEIERKSVWPFVPKQRPHYYGVVVKRAQTPGRHARLWF